MIAALGLWFLLGILVGLVFMVLAALVDGK